MLLHSVWGNFYVACYEIKKNLNVLHGLETIAFTETLMPKHFSFIAKKLVETNAARGNVFI